MLLNLELITSQNGVDYSISYEMVNVKKKNHENTKQKKRFFNDTIDNQLAPENHIKGAITLTETSQYF